MQEEGSVNLFLRVFCVCSPLLHSPLASLTLSSPPPPAALLRGRGGQPHRRGPDDLPEAAERRRQAEHHLQLLPVGGLARPGPGQLRQGHALPGLQRRGDVLRQQPLHPRRARRLRGKF